jgi:hypothetical protein
VTKAQGSAQATIPAGLGSFTKSIWLNGLLAPTRVLEVGNQAGVIQVNYGIPSDGNTGVRFEQLCKEKERMLRGDSPAATYIIEFMKSK